MRSKTYYETNKEAIDALSQALKVNTAYACLMHQRNIQSRRGQTLFKSRTRA